MGESQLVGYPTQFPSVTMLDWTTGRPNARYWTLKLGTREIQGGTVELRPHAVAVLSVGP